MAINSSNPEQELRRAIARAQALKHPGFKLCEGYWACPSQSSPKTGYMVEVFEGKVSCECKGFERTGCCYHAAHVALEEGLIPERFLPHQPGPEPDPAPAAINPVTAAELAFSAAMARWRMIRGEHLVGSEPEREALAAALAARNELYRVRVAAGQLQAA